MNELMYVVLIIGMLMAIALPILLERLALSQTVRVFPYAKLNMEYLAGYHSIHGDWPNEIDSPFLPRQPRHSGLTPV